MTVPCERLGREGGREEEGKSEKRELGKWVNFFITNILVETRSSADKLRNFQTL